MEKAKMKKQVDQILRKVMMFYVLVVIPTGLILTFFLVFTEVHGRALVNSVTPAGLVLLLTYVLYLTKPRWLLQLLNSSSLPDDPNIQIKSSPSTTDN